MKRGDVVWVQRDQQPPEQHIVHVVEFEVAEDGDRPMYFLLKSATGQLVECELRNDVWHEVQWVPVQLVLGAQKE